MKHSFATCAAAVALALGTSAVQAQSTEVPFYFPVAVGGPITKIIDQFATDFNKENPSIKVSPIYAGSYQDTIVKALTANKAGTLGARALLVAAQALEADGFGAQYLARSGYDPQAMIAVMKVLKQASGGAGGAEIFQSHPNPDLRMEQIREYLRQNPPKPGLSQGKPLN